MPPKLKKFQEIYKLVDEGLTKSDFATAFKEVVAYVKRVERDLHDKLDARIAKIKDGRDGVDGARGPKGEKGDKGDKGDRGATGYTLFGKAEPGKDGKDGSPDTGDQIIEKINASDSLIVPGAVEGLVKLEEQVKQIGLRPIEKGGGVGRQDVWHTGDRETMHKLSVQSTAPIGPGVGDLWVDIS